EVWSGLEQVATEAGYELGDALTFDVRLQESGYQASAMLGRPSFMPDAAYDCGCLLFPPGQPWPCVEVVVAAAMGVLRDGGRADFAGLLRVDRIVERGLHEVHDIWAQTYRDVPVASAEQASVIAEIRVGFINGFEEAMRLAISILAETDGAEDQ